MSSGYERIRCDSCDTREIKTYAIGPNDELAYCMKCLVEYSPSEFKKLVKRGAIRKSDIPGGVLLTKKLQAKVDEYSK
jgi:hypothetical protein